MRLNAVIYKDKRRITNVGTLMNGKDDMHWIWVGPLVKVNIVLHEKALGVFFYWEQYAR